jgi:hypothetical protein
MATLEAAGPVAGADGQPDPDDEVGRPAWQRWAICAVATALVGSSILAHTPDMLGGETLRPAGESVLHASGVEIDWIAFAPNPPDRSTYLEARITFADGTTETWRPPAQEPLIGTYWQYRWDKTTEFLTTRASDWAPQQMADSVLRRTERATGREVASVEVVVLRQSIEPLGGEVTEEVVARSTGSSGG